MEEQNQIFEKEKKQEEGSGEAPESNIKLGEVEIVEKKRSFKVKSIWCIVLFLLILNLLQTLWFAGTLAIFVGFHTVSNIFGLATLAIIILQVIVLLAVYKFRPWLGVWLAILIVCSYITFNIYSIGINVISFILYKIFVKKIKD
ncbi:hypothetical protein C4566_03505 [Candidatus Parcubacteria bacterium]|nr:MAG: hypothetical protein C4566_03505 [Candidatus Parcubacteria bacterium]